MHLVVFKCCIVQIEKGGKMADAQMTIAFIEKEKVSYDEWLRIEAEKNKLEMPLSLADPEHVGYTGVKKYEKVGGKIPEKMGEKDRSKGDSPDNSICGNISEKKLQNLEFEKIERNKLLVTTFMERKHQECQKSA